MSIISSRFAIFNNWNFNNVPGLQVYSIQTPGFQQRTLNIFELARRSARKVSSGFYKSNPINIGIYLTPTPSSVRQSGRDALDIAIDQLMQNLQSLEGALVVPVSGGVRQYTATYEQYTINDQKGGYIDMTLTFEASDSFGYDTNYTVIQPATNFTASPVNFAYTQGGTADTQVPVIQVKISAVGSNPGSITVGNLSNGQSITVTRTWAVNDLLIVDCQNKLVQVNGADVAFSGGFPEVGTGLQTLTYSDTFTSRTVNIFIYVYNRYI